MAVGNLKQAMGRVAALPVTHYSFFLDEVLQYAQAAEQHLRAWADALDIELDESMPT